MGKKYGKKASSQGKHYPFVFVRENGKQFTQMSTILDKSGVLPDIENEGLGLQDIQKALASLSSKGRKGKIVIHVSDGKEVRDGQNIDSLLFEIRPELFAG